MIEVPGGSIYTIIYDRGEILSVTYVRQPEMAGPIWHASIVLPRKMSDGTILPSTVDVEPAIESSMSARRLAEVADWLVALYQLAERMDVKYPNGFKAEAAPVATKPKTKSKARK